MTREEMLDDVLRFLRRNPESYIFLDVFCENRWGFKPQLVDSLRTELLSNHLIETSENQPNCVRITPKGFQYYGYRSSLKKKRRWWSRLFSSL
jgi:hypothetical protein